MAQGALALLAMNGNEFSRRAAESAEKGGWDALDPGESRQTI